MPQALNWELLHPRATFDHLGFLPEFVFSDDPRPAKEQLNERYAFGGWRPQYLSDKMTLDDDNTLNFPGDPPFKPIAQAKLRDELIVLYPSDLVAIIQPDRKFEVSRMD